MPPVSSRGPTPISEVGLPSSNRPQTPNLETLAGLLNRNNSSVLDTGNMDGLGSFGLGATGGNITPNPGTLTPTFSSNGRFPLYMNEIQKMSLFLKIKYRNSRNSKICK